MKTLITQKKVESILDKLKNDKMDTLSYGEYKQLKRLLMSFDNRDHKVGD
jgi:hypothetical protein